MSEAPTMTREAAAVASPPLPDATIPGRRPGEVGKITIPRGELIPGTATGDNAEFVTKWDSREQRGGAQEVSISGETAQKHFNTLRTYADSLATASSEDLNMILNDPARASDRVLMDKLCTTVIGDEGEVKYTVDQDKIIQFLQTSNGLATSTMLLEEESLLLKMGIGMDAALRDQFSRGQKQQSRDGLTVLDKVPTLPGLAKIGIKNTVLGAIAAGYVAVGSGKSKLVFSSDDDLLKAVKASETDAQKAYLKVRAGINLDGINPDGSYKEWYNPDIDNLKLRVTNADNLRRETLDQLGFDKPGRLDGRVPRNRQIRYAEEFIFNPGMRAEDMPVGYLQKIMDTYGGDIDAALTAAITAAGVATVADLPAGVERYVRLNEMAKARSKVMVEYVTADIKVNKAEQSKVEEAQAIASLKEKKRLMTERPEEYRTGQKRGLEETKRSAEERRTEATQRRDALQTSFGTREQAFTQKQSELLSPKFGVTYTGDIDANVTTRIGDLETEIQTALTTVPAGGDSLQTLLGARSSEIKTNQDAILARWEAVAGKGRSTPYPTEALAAEKARIEADYAPRIDPLLRTYNRLTQQLAGLEAKKQEYDNADEELKNEVHKLVARSSSSERNPLIQAQKAHGTLTAALGLTVDEISKRSVQNIADALGALPPPPVVGPPHPWGTTASERLEFALQAKAIEESSRTVSITAEQTAAIAALAGLGTPLTVDDILRMPQIDVVNAQTAALIPAADAQKNARNAYEAALIQRRSFEQAKVTQEIGHYDAVIKNAKTQLESLGNLEPQKAELDAAITMLENATSLGAENTLSKAYAIPDDPDKFDALVNITMPVAAGDIGYSQAEITLGEERYLYEWYRLLYPQYVGAPEKRDEMFQAVTRLFPPNELRSFLRDYSARNNINGTNADLRVLTKAVLNQVRDRALTI